MATRKAIVEHSPKFTTVIEDRSFNNIYIGDYIERSVTIGGTIYTDRAYVAHIDPYFSEDDNCTVVNTHHVGLVHIIMDLTHNRNTINTTVGAHTGPPRIPKKIF